MVDPITLIVESLATGAVAAAKDVVSEAVKNAYNGLKALIVSKCESKPDVASSLQFLEKKPTSTPHRPGILFVPDQNIPTNPAD